MKKINCNVIEDLLPLYIDEICNEDTKELVEEHLKDCKKCKEQLQQMTGIIPTESEVPTPEKQVIKRSIRKMKMFKYALIGIAMLCILVIFVVVPVKNSIRREGITYSNIKEVYIVNAFFNALEKQDYEKAFSYFDTSELSQSDDVTYQKFVDGMKKLEEEGKGWKKHHYLDISPISDDEYQIEISCTMDNNSTLTLSLHVTECSISPYISGIIPETGGLNYLLEEVFKFVYTDEEVSLLDSVKAENGEIVSYKINWQHFLTNTRAGNKDEINVYVYGCESPYWVTIKYDDGVYTYSSSLESEKYSYKYILELEGKFSGSGLEDSMIVMANEEYTFEEITNGITTSQSNEMVDCLILFN